MIKLYMNVLYLMRQVLKQKLLHWWYKVSKLVVRPRKKTLLVSTTNYKKKLGSVGMCFFIFIFTSETLMKLTFHADVRNENI